MINIQKYLVTYLHKKINQLDGNHAVILSKNIHSQGAIHTMYIKKNNKTNIHFSHLTEHILHNNILP